MARRILLISKPPEFDPRGEVVLGQCEPFTSGWELRLFVDGKIATLITGTYADIRRLQEMCASTEAPDKIRAKIEEMKPLLASAGTETITVSATTERPSRAVEAEKAGDAVEEAETAPEQIEEAEELEPGEDKAEGDDDEDTEQILVTVEAVGKGLVATVQDPSVVADIGVLNQTLSTLAEQEPAAIVLNIGCVENLSSRAARELERFRDECREKGCRFVLGAVRQSVSKVLKLLEPPAAIETYPSLEGAVEAIKK